MAIQVLKWRPRGPVGFAPIIVGADGRNAPGAFKNLTCVDELKLDNNVNYIEHRSKCSAIGALDYRDVKDLTSNLTITFSDFVTETMIAALLAATLAADSAPVVISPAQVLPAVLVGESVQLGGADPATTITSLVVTDSAGTPATLVAGTDYTLDAVYGMVTFLNLGTFVQPFKAAYSKKNPLTLAGLKAAPINRWMTFQGFNAANANKLVTGNLFKVSFSPASLDFLPDELGLLTMQATLLIDTSRPTSDPLGQYYSIGLGA